MYPYIIYIICTHNPHIQLKLESTPKSCFRHTLHLSNFYGITQILSEDTNESIIEVFIHFFK